MDELLELRGLVLAVAVDLRHVVVAVLARIDEAGLDGAADPEVERQRRRSRRPRGCACGSLVGRAVIDHDHVELGRPLISAVTTAATAALVVCGYDRQHRRCLQDIRDLYYPRVPMGFGSLTAVIVAHDSLGELRRTLPALLAQLGPGDELIVVDNASTDGLEPELTSSLRARQLGGRNAGFAAGVNAGAAVPGELLVLLNPDVVVEPGWSDAIRAPWDGDGSPGWGS